MAYQKDKGTGGKACWKGYRRVGANGCTKVANYKKSVSRTSRRNGRRG